MKKPFNGNYPLTQGFGANPAYYQKHLGLKAHNGQDWGLPNGTTVVAAHPGRVFVGWEPSGYGNYVFITGASYQTVYGHLQRAVVTTGQQVAEGQAIALSDNTGFSTGAHLHWGVRPITYNQNDGYRGYIDPQPLLNQTNSGGNMPQLSQGVIDAFTKPMTDADEARYYQQFLGRQRESGPTGRTYGNFVFDAVPEIIANSQQRLALIKRVNELEAAGGANLANATPKQLLEAALKKL